MVAFQSGPLRIRFESGEYGTLVACAVASVADDDPDGGSIFVFLGLVDINGKLETRRLDGASWVGSAL
jgi:hypothetical protein